MSERETEQTLSLRDLASYYADYIRENKGRKEPKVGVFKEYLEANDVPSKAVNKSTLNAIREYAYKDNEDLQDLAINEFYFSEEYFDKFEQMLQTTKKFIISTVVAGKAAKVGFYNTMLNWAEQNNAHILLIPSADIKNANKVFDVNFDPIFRNDRTWIVSNRNRDDDDTFSVDETPDGYYLNKHLWLSCVKCGAKTVEPISGWDELLTKKDSSIIVGSPRQQLRYVAAMKHKTPRAVMSTGCCTVNNYNTDKFMSAKTSAKAKEAHQFGAVIVEVENENIFHFRQVQSKDGESFTDLYAKYTPDGNVTLARKSVLVMGDSHAGATDMRLLKDILTKLVSYAGVEEVVLHDLCDARPVSPHDQGKLMTNVDKVARGKHLLKNTFEEIVDYLNTITSVGLKVTVVASNHDEHLNRALENLPCWLNDYANTSTMLQMSYYYHNNQKGALLKYCVENIPTTKLAHPDRINWLTTDQPYQRYGCELGQHGHLGANGSKGNVKQYSKFVGNVVIGHSHSAGIMNDAFQVGTTSELDQGYNKGLSSWTRTCCLVHADGTKQLINFIPNGEGGYNFRIED